MTNRPGQRLVLKEKKLQVRKAEHLLDCPLGQSCGGWQGDPRRAQLASVITV